ncbi:MAG TPA: HAMP domain-containing sensor histidine kinase [Thermomicrobiaceae bacterium]|nr:HAMP domain-containing sensor histidine kinase [Thermomicrobiaceae bacterium]
MASRVDLRMNPSQASRPSLGLAFRWLVAFLGGAALVTALLTLSVHLDANFVLLVILAALADALLQIHLRDGRAVSLASTFTFVLFLQYGAVAAALAHAVGLLVRSGLRRARTGQADTLTFTAFNLGQLSLSALGAGLLVRAALGGGLAQPAADPGLALVLYAPIFLAGNIIFTSTAVWLSHGADHVRAVLWPRTSLWTAISFCFTAPLALATLGIAQVVPFAVASVLVFFAAAGLHAIVQLNLELGERNQQLARANLDLQTINDAARVLASEIDLVTLGPALQEQVSCLVRTDAFLFARAEGRDYRVEWVAEQGQARPARPSDRSPLVEQVVRSGEMVVARQPEELRRLGIAGWDADGAVAGIPLRVAGRTVRAFVVRSQSSAAYTERQLSLLETLAHNAAVSLENAALVEKLRAALRDREEYLSVVSHELKNPIAAIQAYAQLAVRRSSDEDERLHQTLGRIAGQTDRLRRLVDDLLSLSRIDTGHFALERVESDLRTLANQAIEEARESYGDYHFALCAPDAPVSAAVDPARMLQVLDNLISNAVKYSPEGSAIDVLVDQAEHEVRLTVRDQGVGISPEDQQRIFTRFYRAPGSEEHAAGLGIGLSVVLELVRAHDGRIDLRSTPGRGSDFSVVLPIS